MKLHEYDPLDSPELREFVHHFLTRQEVDRIGIFRYDSESCLIQGVIGVDDQGEIENITSQLYAATIKEPTSPLQDVAQGLTPWSLSNDSEVEHPEWHFSPMKFGYAVVPIFQSGKVVGILAVDNKLTGRPLQESQITAFIEAAMEVAPYLARLEVTQATDFMADIVDTLAEGVCLAGTGGWVLYGNRALSEMYGFPPEVVVQKHMHELFFPLSADGMASPLWDEMQGHQGPWQGEVMNRRADGTLLPVCLQIFPLFSRKNTSCQMVVVQDMTPFRELERALLDKAELEGAMKVIRTFNHKVNNALQGLIGNLELLQMKTAEEGDPIERYIRNIGLCSEEITQTLRRISQLTHLESIPHPGGEILHLPKDAE